MKIRTTQIAGVEIVENQYMEDSRGFFGRLFCQQELGEVLGERQVVQVNHSHTKQLGSVRGFHYQKPPYAEMKLVRCIKGKVWDVVVDLRAGSPTFLQWFTQELSEENNKVMVIPEGCAHGFQILQENSELIYLHTAPYTPEAEGGVHVADPVLAVDWPLPITGLSARDESLPNIERNFLGITL